MRVILTINFIIHAEERRQHYNLITSQKKTPLTAHYLVARNNKQWYTIFREYDLEIENTMKENQKIDLIRGDILKSLLYMALPIMGTSFIQMAYNMTDMFWIGMLGSRAVTAVGLGGFFVWLSNAVIALSKTGTEVRVAQSTGAGKETLAEHYARTGLQFVAFTSLLYAAFLVVFRWPLIGFFNTGNYEVESMAVRYLTVVGAGMLFPFANQVFTGIFNGRGDSRTPFVVNGIGLAINMVLDPVLIHVFDFGVTGAAVATVVAQAIVFLIFLYRIKWQHTLYKHFTIFVKPKLSSIAEIVRLGVMPGLQNGLFTGISMVIARIIAEFGELPIGVQKVGSQIESITWMTALGLSVALGAFVGQNYGAGQYARVKKGYRTALRLALILGAVNTFVLFFFSKWLFMIFLREQEAVALGIDYLKILSVSQLFMFVEITVTGAFNGIGMTKPAAITSIVFNALRIPMALYFSQMTFLGLNGIWWSITISSIFKGIIAYIWFEHTLKTKDVFIGVD